MNFISKQKYFLVIFADTMIIHFLVGVCFFSSRFKKGKRNKVSDIAITPSLIWNCSDLPLTFDEGIV